MTRTSPGGAHDPTIPSAQARPVLWRDALLISAVLAPPGAWAVALSLDFALVYPAAHAGSKVSLWAVSIVAVAIAAGSAAVAFGVLRQAERAGQSPEEMTRIRALVVAAYAFAVFFVLAIVALMIPVAALELE